MALRGTCTCTCVRRGSVPGDVVFVTRSPLGSDDREESWDSVHFPQSTQLDIMDLCKIDNGGKHVCAYTNVHVLCRAMQCRDSHSFNDPGSKLVIHVHDT